MRKACAQFSLLVVFVLLIPAGCSKGPLDSVPTLTVGPVPSVQRPQLDIQFSQATILGHTYSLPCLGSEFVDNGWAPSSEDRRSVDAHDTAEIYLVADSLQLRLVLRNDGDQSVPWDQAQVVGINTDRGRHDGPMPQIQLGMAKEDVVALLGTPDLDDVTDEDGRYNTVGYYGLSVQSARLSDAGLLSASLNGDAVQHVGGAGLVLFFYDDRYSGSYGLSFDLGGPFDSDMTVPGDDVRCGSFESLQDYSYQLPSDFQGSRSGSGARLAEYVVGGEAYLFGVSGLGWCREISSDKSHAEKVDDHLIVPMSFSGHGGATPGPRVSTPGEAFLLWDRKDSSAAVLVSREKGDLTGDEFVRVWLNYCDWRSGFQVSWSFSVISVEPGVAVSDDVESYLLAVVSGVAESVTRTH